jgi:hypothetical protein
MRPTGAVRHKDVPVVVGAVFIGFERDNLCGLDGVRVIEQQQLNEDRIFREYAEVDAAIADRRAKRSTRARSQTAGVHACCSPGAIARIELVREPAVSISVLRPFVGNERGQEADPAE